MAKKKKLTVESSMADFKTAYRSKSRLLEREKDDFMFALGEQWSKEDVENLAQAGIKPVTDNRIAPNLFLLTGLERQNRTDFKAFPEGEEDGIRANIASALLKDSIKKSGFSYKSSEQFKDGITCGESHLELYLDNTESLINGAPRWNKCDGNVLFPDPKCREYDFSDARYIYKLKLDLDREDLINLFPDKEGVINKAESGRLDLTGLLASDHIQHRDYPKTGDEMAGDEVLDTFDLLERYYKKWVQRVFIGDRQTGQLRQTKDLEEAEEFVASYQETITADATTFQEASDAAAATEGAEPPPPPPQQDPERFIVLKRSVPEIWYFAHSPGVDVALADEVAWFYPKWKEYPFVPFYARFSTAPLTGDARHLLIQGLVHGVKGSQEKHNKAEMLMLRHLNSSTNSGWLTEEDAWVDPQAVKKFGSAPGINLEYKRGRAKPERIVPAPLSQAHAVVSAESAESIKAQLGINADLLASQQGGGDSGRAIALRQRQGLLMVQELFDNLTRSRKIAGRFLLAIIGEIYDTETAVRVLGEAFLIKNFPAPQILNEETGEPEAMPDATTGDPMQYDKEMAEVEIAAVLTGELEKYDVAVGESVASDSQRLANSAEVKEVAAAFPGLIGPDILIKHSQLPEDAKAEILQSLIAAQQAAQEQENGGDKKPPPKKPPATKKKAE